MLLVDGFGACRFANILSFFGASWAPKILLVELVVAGVILSNRLPPLAACDVGAELLDDAG